MSCPTCGKDCTDCDIKRIFENLTEQVEGYRRDIESLRGILDKYYMGVK